MKGKTRETLKFTADHAVRALHFLISDGKIAARDVATALKRRERQIKELKDRLAALEGPESERSKRQKQTEYLEKRRPKPNRHGGSGSGRQQGGSGAGRERG